MIARLGYCRLLPLANILLFAILISVGYFGSNSSNAIGPGVEIAHSAQSEGWQPTYLERPTPLTHLFAWSLNFPAMLFATPFGFLAKGWHADLLVNVVTALYLVILWFVVGLWLDRHDSPGRTIRRTPMLHTIRWTALVVSSAAFLLVTAVIVARLMLHQFAETACTIPMLFWPFFLAYAARWEITHSNGSAQTKAAVA